MPSPSSSVSSESTSSDDVAASCPSSLLAAIIEIWKEHYKLIVSDYAVTGWLLSVRQDIKEDASSSVTASHKECADCVIEKLYHSYSVEQQMEIKNTF